MRMKQADFHVSRIDLPELKRFGVAVQYFTNYVNKNLRMHTVDVTLISFVLDGYGKHYIGDQVYEEEGGSLGITYQGQQRDLLTDENGMDVYNLYLDLDRLHLPEFSSELRDMLHVILILHPAFRNEMNQSVYLKLDDPKPLLRLIQAIETETQNPKTGAEDMVDSYLKLFFGNLCRVALEKGVQPSPLKSGEFPRWVDKIRKYIDQHFEERLGLDDFTNLTGMSKGHMCREFKRYTGFTLINYLIERRIQAVMLRLRNSNQKIIQIAIECGFDDLAFFNRKFKSIVGLSPTAYRKQVSDQLIERQ